MCIKINAILAIVCLIFSGYSFAESTVFSCKYPAYSNIKGLHTDDKLILKIRMEEVTQKAYMLGNNDALIEVTMIPQNDGNGMTFLEVTDSGNVTTTSIDTNGMSVHSRNTIIDGMLLPSQYYGECVIAK